MKPERLRELAEVALSFIKDNGLLDEFLEDRDILLSQNEREYFFPDDDDEEDWNDYDDNWVDQDY